jgi:hypothetical protein
MNRLVIVGNGFDLAHGMKTRYNDFFLWYLKQSYDLAYTNEDGSYEDGALRIIAERRHKIKIMNHQGISEFVDYFYNCGELLRMTSASTFEDGVYMHDQNPFVTSIKSDFVAGLINNCSITNWVDIENFYYDYLKQAMAHPIQEQSDDLVAILNVSLSAIIDHLEIYLSSLPTTTPINEYQEIMNSPIKLHDLVLNAAETELETKETYILNFNYTSTIEKYLQPKMTINYIHGQLNDNQNPLIFGFGDELDAEYSQFELNKTEGIFKYIKSFWYFRTRNYHNLIRFIESDQYQVVILGHSCGLSDRTMLNMILDDANCKSVKIYHHLHEGKDNYTEITHEIARHFKNKQEMRKKIVPFDRDSFMPQWNSN